MTDYKKQADDFCQKNNVTIKIVQSPLQNPPKWCKEGEKHGLQYDIVITRENRKPFIFSFWDSIHNKEQLEKLRKPYEYGIGMKWTPKEKREEKAKEFIPNEYSVLACLTKYDPETFEDFCASYGYDTDSIKARETFDGVDKEWHAVKRMFSDCLEELQDIN